MSRTRPLSPPKTPASTAPRPQADVPRLALSERNAAASLDVPRSTFRDLVQRHGIPYIEFGNGSVKRRRLYMVEDLRSFLLSQRRGDQP